MKPDRIVRNITFRRLVLDFYQDIRCQKWLVRWMGRPFRRNRRFIEFDLTYRCNLRCKNCNRSCTQAPSSLELTPGDIDAFIRETLEKSIQWERIHLLGGEPTLHNRFFDILERLMNYRAAHNPNLVIVVCTNGCGRQVNDVLRRLPEEVTVKNTFKGKRQRLFRPFNVAPIDRPRFAFSDLTAGCRILHDCGMGLTPLGYYPCSIAGGIDRVFGFDGARSHLPDLDDEMMDQLALFCRYCGHFGFAWPTRNTRLSPTWEAAYRRFPSGQFKKENRQNGGVNVIN
jgi:hypothetical protein